MKSVESYKHKAAKEVLAGWLSELFMLAVEQPFYLHGKCSFIPDVTAFDYNGDYYAIYEVVHKHGLDAKKLSRIQQWSYLNQIPINVYEIEAEWILLQVVPPETLRLLNFTTLS